MARARAGRAAAAREPVEGKLARALLITVALTFVGLFLLLPLIAVFSQALQGGAKAYLAAVTESDAAAAIRLTLWVTALVVPLNAVLGLVAAWALGRFSFAGKGVLLTLLDLPFSVSPVVAGLLFVLLFGRQGWLGPWLAERQLHVIFALPGIVIATLFVTFPFVAREVLAVMQSQGREPEEAALTLGANGWQTFFRVTLPRVRWGVLYGVVLCSARAMGEFGAVSVVSGHIRGVTTTLPLHVETLYNDFNFVGAFAVASLLTLLSLLTLVAKRALEQKRGAA
ncbi:MAG: sulfate ABC transporter permease subunit CysW [Proteobacteria bacterium]|nr:sulfate ABC transporter permease subunit CysW [Pseudomonadota bacterium]